MPPFVPPVLPAEIQVVVDDPNTFTLPADLTPDPNAPPVAETSALTGCWARTSDPEELDVSSQDTGGLLPGPRRLNVRTIDLWHFDATAQTVQYELYMRDEPTGIILLQSMSGTFEVREPGIVAVRFERFAINDWSTGQMLTEPPPDGDVPESLLRVERSGDRLFYRGSPADTSGDEAPWVYQRFDCP